MGHAVATLRTAFADVWANRRSFWVQVLIMLVNDAVWVVFWILFFRRVGSLRGWDADRVLLLFSILTTVSGLAVGVLGNSRLLGRIAADGELDEVLTLPTSPLLHLLTRRIDAVILGDLAFGPVLFAVAGHPTPQRAALFVLGSLAGASVVVGFMVAASSLTLFIGGRGEQADLGFQALLILASYPLDVFGGPTKALLYTAVPAAFVTGLPTSLVDDVDVRTVAVLAAATVGFPALGVAVFHAGLRRYSSGGSWAR